MDLGSVTPGRHVRAGARLVAEGRTEPTVAAAYRLLCAVLNTAVDDGRIRRNPCRVKRGDRVRTPERPVATVAQVSPSPMASAAIPRVQPRGRIHWLAMG